MSGVQTPTIQLAFDPADGFPADDTLTSQGGRGSTPIAARSACKRLGKPLADALGVVVGVFIVRLSGCLRWVDWRLPSLLHRRPVIRAEGRGG